MPNEPADDPNAAGSVHEHPPNPGVPSNRLVPDAVARRLLRIGDQYYFPDRTLAFVDTGTRLKVRTHNLEVVHTVVAIMQARGWQQVRLTGTQEFRQMVWHEATLQGIGVQGYEPSALELQQLQHALDRSRAGRGAPDGWAAPDSRKDEASEGRRTARDGLRPPTVGVLLAHAAAPYQFDPRQRMSYYVRVHTEVGERTLWGADFERALAESRSGAKVGDEIVLRQRGARPVTVRVPERNAQGELVGEKKLATQRMGWTVETVDYLELLKQKASALRDGDIAGNAVLSRYPDLAGAVAGLRLARQFAQRLTPSADDQARIVDAIRTGMANAIAQGRHIELPQRRTPPSHVRQRGRAMPTIDDPGHLRA